MSQKGQRVHNDGIGAGKPHTSYYRMIGIFWGIGINPDIIFWGTHLSKIITPNIKTSLSSVKQT